MYKIIIQHSDDDIKEVQWGKEDLKTASILISFYGLRIDYLLTLDSHRLKKELEDKELHHVKSISGFHM